MERRSRSSRSRSRSPSDRKHRLSRSRSRSRDRDRDRDRSRKRSSRWSPRRDDDGERERRSLLPPPPPPPPPAPGQILRAVVRSVVPFGAFVELLHGDDEDDDDNRRGAFASPSHHRRPRPLQALVHSSLVSEETSRFSRDDDPEDRKRAISFFAPPSSRVWVKVVDVDRKEDGQLKISASMRSVSQEDGNDLDPEGRIMLGGRGGDFSDVGSGSGRSRRPPGNRQLSPPGDGPLSPFPPAVGSILRARVASATKFGAFVLLEGWGGGGRGLVHITQIAEGLDPTRLKEATDDERQEAVASMLPVGSELFVKVVDVVESAPSGEGEGDGGGDGFARQRPQHQQFKVSCSAKVVDQETGADLDPRGDKAPRGGKGAGEGAATAPSTTAAGAVSGEAGIVQWGHLAAEKYKGASGKDYALVEETAEEAAAAAAAAVEAEESAIEAEKRAAAGPPPPPPPAITSVEDALAILEKLEGGGKKRKGKKDKKKKEKKRRKKEKKSKKHYHRRRSSSSTSSSSSESD